jgi:hypothetical protein
MKATIDFDERLYRRLKVEAARQGRTIRDLVDEGVRRVLGLPVDPEAEPQAAADDWFGSLSKYAANAGGEHDLAAIRRSIARGRSGS